MRRRLRRMKPTENAEAVLGSDLYMAFGGVVIVLLLAALCAMGVPEIKASEHAKLKKNYEWLKDASKTLYPELQKAEKERDAAKAELEERKKEAEQAVSRAEAAEGQLEPRPLDVVIAFDGSESMEPWMDKARTSIESMVEVCARIAPRFRLGIVVYRRDTTLFDLQVIGGTKKGVRSDGMKALLAFFNDKTERRTVVSNSVGELGGSPTGEVQWEPKLSGYLTPVDPVQGIRKAISIFDDASARKVLVLISDVGPWELDDPDTISAWEGAQSGSIQQMAKDFSNSNARVLALFTGADASNLTHKRETEKFFRRVASASNGTYSDDPNQLAAIVLSECFRHGGKKR